MKYSAEELTNLIGETPDIKEKAIRSHRLKRRKLLRPIRKTKTKNEMYNDTNVY